MTGIGHTCAFPHFGAADMRALGSQTRMTACCQLFLLSTILQGSALSSMTDLPRAASMIDVHAQHAMLCTTQNRVMR